MERPYKMRSEKWDCMDLMSFDHHQEDHDHPWSVKNYACSFCKRQFRSAQALGGHMNVHRRDRARLRLLPSSLNSECPNHNKFINPNPNFSSLSTPTSSSAKLLPYNHNPHFFSSPNSLTCLGLSSSASIEKGKQIFNSPHDQNILLSPKRDDMEISENDDHLKAFGEKGKLKALNNKEGMIRLDLEMGLQLNDDEREDSHVDLELRLGH